MKRIFLAVLALLVGLGLFSACGQKAGEKTKPTAPAPDSAQASPPAPAEAAAESEGVRVAKDILAAFDQAVAEAAELAKPKPETSELRPRIQEIFDRYKPRMEELNTRFLALREKDIRLFGEANGYLGEHRGRHVYQKDVTLGEALAYYNLQKGDMEFVTFLSSKLVELVDIASAIR